MSDSKITNTGFILNVLSLIMLIGIGGSVENMPPDAGGAAWLFVLLEPAGAVGVGLIGSNLLMADNKRVA